MIKNLIQSIADKHKEMKDKLGKVINETMDELIERIGKVLEEHHYREIYVTLNLIAKRLEDKLKRVIPDIKVWGDAEWWALEIYSEERAKMTLEEEEKKGYGFDLAKYVWEFLRKNVDLKELKVGGFGITLVNKKELKEIERLLNEWLQEDWGGGLLVNVSWQEVKRSAFEGVLHDYSFWALYEERIKGK
jgi:hypothetical protein